MNNFEVKRFCRTIEHPLGEGLYMEIRLGFTTKEKADEFRNKELDWEDGIVVEEITEEEYILATED